LVEIAINSWFSVNWLPEFFLSHADVFIQNQKITVMITFNITFMTRPVIVSFMVAACSFIPLSCKNDGEMDTAHHKGVEHGIIYYEEGRYAGWPANNGIWSWDNNEILVGFAEGEHDASRGFHTIKAGTSSSKYARSMDGGITWTIEDAYERGQITEGTSGEKSGHITRLTESIDDFTDPGFIFTFRRHNSHYGPSYFYYSINRGERWIGPYEFPDLGTPGVATRTDYIIDGKQQLSAFLTVGKSNRREGRVAYARTDDGALNWELVSYVGPEPAGFDIMPSSLRLSPTELITTIRTRNHVYDYSLGHLDPTVTDIRDPITAYISDNNGESWEQLRDPVACTGYGGSPSALVKLDDGRLALGYIYRSAHGSRVNVKFSSDNGRTWGCEIMLREDGANRDTGYPVMVQRTDGKLIMIYYWNNALQEGATPHRYLAYTIFDPERWK